MTAVFALFGYILVKFECEPAPLVLGFILGPLMEENLRRSLVISRGDPMVFLERPISATLLVLTVAVIALIVLPQIRKSRDRRFRSRIRKGTQTRPREGAMRSPQAAPASSLRARVPVRLRRTARAQSYPTRTSA